MPDPAAVERDLEGPKEACGVFGVYAPGQPVAHLTYLGLVRPAAPGPGGGGHGRSATAQQSPSSRTWASCPTSSTTARWPRSQGHLAIGHTRYSTTGASHVAQRPARLPRASAARQFALGHNGNLTNTEALAEEAGMLPGTVTSDSDLVAELLAAELAHRGRASATADDLERALLTVLPRARGRVLASSSSTRTTSIGVRDPNGFRPLCLGRLDGGWVLASETPALDIVGAHFVRELDPGEMVVIDADRRAARCARSPRTRIDPHALPVRVRLLRPARQPALRPQRARRPRAHGRAARRAGAGRAPTW